MGLTNQSIGLHALDAGLTIKKRTGADRVVAVAGNPNVGKSTLFNALTGMRQHTGNWPGKTVASAQGYCDTSAHSYVLVDIPGTYSLMAHSAEEAVARDFICFGAPDAVVVVCDATCLERNLNLVLQTMEMTPNVLVCLNLMDEAHRKDIHIDIPHLSQRLGLPVVGCVARKKRSLVGLTAALNQLIADPPSAPLQVRYPQPVEQAVSLIEPALQGKTGGLRPRWLALKLLERDPQLLAQINAHLGRDPAADPHISAALAQANTLLAEQGITGNQLQDRLVASLVLTAEDLCLDTVHFQRKTYNETDRKIDKILTGKWVGYPVMLLLLAGVFWLTIVGANYPSQLLSNGLFWVQDRLTDLFTHLNAPDWLHGILVLGVYRTLAWVVAVMLPPMAIFFPLFTLLEDAGYLPRVAYNLDKPFRRCDACGKQALTMCMGFGCNAAGIVGCRIIDSPRERLIAMLTNAFVPCNGRFPTLIALITMFLIGAAGLSGGAGASILSALALTAVIVLGVLMTFAASKFLSRTLLKGAPSSFTLELPPYRRPQVGRVLVRSVLDRALYVLGRAVAVAAPAGLLIWVMANVSTGGASILSHCAGFLDPFARLLGLDGVILMAFILGFPANEIVIPIIIMAYMATGTLTDFSNLAQLKDLLVANGWTWVTAVCTLLFSLMHWPCSTTLLTIKKETGSWKWTALAALLPTAAGMLCCFIVAALARLFL